MTGRRFVRDIAAWALAFGALWVAGGWADARGVPVNILTLAAAVVITVALYTSVRWLVYTAYPLAERAKDTEGAEGIAGEEP